MRALKKRDYESSAPDYSPLGISEEPKSIITGSLWMLGLTLLLFIGAIIGGAISNKQSKQTSTIGGDR